MELKNSSSGGGTSDQKQKTQCAASPGHSCVSLKSDVSMGIPPAFSHARDPSCVSLKSDVSMGIPPAFSHGREPSCESMKSDWLRNEAFEQVQHSSEEALQALTVEEGPRDLQQDSYSAVEEVLHTHRTRMKNKYENLFEGIRTPENKILLNRVYTQLYIIEGEIEGVNEEHEVLQMEKTPRKHQEDTPIHCSDIFKPLQGPDGGVKAEDLRLREDKGAGEPEIRRVLTKGIAGIGKTVSVQKFIVDWAEGTANQEVDLMFVLPFRELNLIKDDQYSLHGLLCAFHPELRDLDPEINDQLRAVFIFDGLDESKVPLDFKQWEKVSDITVTSSVSVLMTNLIRGDLLPSASIWITSRPAAANQIPPQYIHRLTEIQGFTDPQKEEYFRKRIMDQDQAQKIISHIKTVRSLHIMCHIPVFCWISATVLQRIIKQRKKQIPKTLTGMYSYFLLTQTNMEKEKYEEKNERDPEKLLESNRTELLKLAELAFTQLLKGNVMFYEEDLRENSIDVTEASVYSGIFTEIFREECVIHQRKVYCFVHLSFQEFLAAVFVFHCYENNIMETLQYFTPWCGGWSGPVFLDDLLKGAVDKAVESQDGHLDLFLRFLLGLSLESNQSLLQGLLTQTHSRSEETREYIMRLIKGDEAEDYEFGDEVCDGDDDDYENDDYMTTSRSLSSERLINLFLCLSEMKDQSLSREIEYLKSEKLSKVKLSPGQCSVLVCMLLTSEEELDELNLNKYNTSEEGYKRLIPAVTVCRKARLAICNLGHKACEILGSVLQSVNSYLKELDLSNNDLQDSGVELLSAGLRSSFCKLETLRLSGCMITDEGCSILASALKSAPSHLRELDLTYNHTGESGVKLLSDLLQDPHCALENLQVKHREKVYMKSGLKKYSCKLTLDPNTAHTDLFLSEGNREVTRVRETQLYPDHPERFDMCRQVLCVESLTGRCYWEVELSGWRVDISVSYKGIGRKGNGVECVFGLNTFSWSLICSGNSYWVRHNNQETEIPAPTSNSNRVGVYLDWVSGTLSFYTISPHTHTLTHLHSLPHSQSPSTLGSGLALTAQCLCLRQNRLTHP